MPSLGADMEAGRVAKWLIAPGSRVHRGDVVAEVDTEKATIDAEIFEDGVVEVLLVAEGELVPVGTPLARITAEAGAPVVAAAAAPPVVPPMPHRARPKVGAPATRAPVTRPKEAAKPTRRQVRTHVRASPMARRRARELSIDLQVLHGSGPAGAIVAADVEQANETAMTPATVSNGAAPVARAGRLAAEASTPSTREDRSIAMRHAIGALMARSKREIPHYYLETTIDFGRAEAWIREVNKERPPQLRVLAAAVLLKATAHAAKETPQMNGFFANDAFQPSDAVHLGVAISLRQGGLVAPAIHDVDALGIDDVTAALKDLVNRARSGRLRSSEMADPTLTVTDLGEHGVDKVFGVIYPPQVALVGFGKILERLCVVNGLIGVRPLVTATLSADHRVSDGATGSHFLAKIDRLLQAPEAL